MQNLPAVANPEMSHLLETKVEGNLQSRTVCGIMKPLCPAIKFACNLCRYYLATEVCKKTCQASGNYCLKSKCEISSDPCEPVIDITDNGKKNLLF